MWEITKRMKLKWPKEKVLRLAWRHFIDPSKCINWNPSSHRQDQEGEKSNGMEREREIFDESNERKGINLRIRKAIKRSF